MIVRRDIWYGTGDYADEPDAGGDTERETFEVLYGQPGDPRFNGGGQYASLGEAVAAAGRTCSRSLAWEPDRYVSRNELEQAPDPASLCSVLRAQILTRLAESSDRAREAFAIIADLRSAGHALWSWDESDDFTVWGDDYIHPPLRTRFMIKLRWPFGEEESGEVQVKITYGPWPIHK